MDKKSKIIFIIVAIVIIIAVFIFTKSLSSTKNNSSSKLEISSVDDLKDLVEEIYKEDKPFPTLDTRIIDTSNSTDVQSVTGSDNGNDFEYLVVSEPMISSQAYSFVLGKVKSGVNADKVAEEMYNNIDPRKWICVSAEKVCATSSGDIAILIMTSKEKTEKVYNKFKELAGSVGKEYSKDVQDEFNEDLDDESSLFNIEDLEGENSSNDVENQEEENLSNDTEELEENSSDNMDEQDKGDSSNNLGTQNGFQKPIISLDELKNNTTVQ